MANNAMRHAMAVSCTELEVIQQTCVLYALYTLRVLCVRNKKEVFFRHSYTDKIHLHFGHREKDTHTGRALCARRDGGVGSTRARAMQAASGV